VLQGFNDLCTTHPELAKEWDYNKNKLSPTEVSKGSAKKIWWICSEGHSYLSSVSNRTKGKGCPYCAGQRVLKGFNDLATIYPELVKEWDYSKNIIKPTEVTRGGGGKFYWLCKNGHSYQSTISHRIEGNGCPYCSGKKVLIGFNDVATTVPKILDYWDYDKNIINPTEITKGSCKKIWFIKDGKEYNTTIHNFLRYI
jgi:DNA-directed RNA polymerase subunit RPC12/RpoP